MARGYPPYSGPLVAKKPIASAAGKTGQVARATAPAVGSPAWLAGASSGDIAVYNLGLAPDYSKVPKVDVKAAASYANAGAEKTLAPVLSEYKQQWTDLAAREQVSLEASTAFTKALSDILTGGQSGEAGRDYALKTFGGSFLGEIQTAEGLKMFVNLSREFDAQDAAIVANMNAAIAKRPDIYKSLYDDFVQQETANQKLGIALADSAYDHRMKAVALILSTRQKQEAAAAKTTRGQVIYAGDGSSMLVDPVTGKKIADLGGARPDTTNVQTQTVGKSLYERDPVTGEWNLAVKGPDAAARQVIYRGDGSSFLIDKATGKKIAELGSARPKGAGSKDTQTGMVAGSLYEKDPADGTWKLAIKGASGGKAVTPTQASETVARADKAGEAALTKLTDKVWSKTPGADAKEGTSEYAKAVEWYQAQLPKSFNSAMYRVITAIAPHLKALGYTSAKVKEKAYEIVSAEIDPPKGYKYKPTKARNISTTYDIVTPKTGIVPGTSWTGTHVTDNLGWGTKTAEDIMAKPGTPVGAPEDGEVVRWGSAQGGQALYFQGVSGKLYWLGHIDGMAPVGTRVRANQQIAVVSADHASPHLHIDVRDTGASV